MGVFIWNNSHFCNKPRSINTVSTFTDTFNRIKTTSEPSENTIHFILLAALIYLHIEYRNTSDSHQR